MCEWLCYVFLIVFDVYYYSAVECSRWKELTDALKFHAQLADIAQAPTEFRLLNGAPPIVVGRGNDGGENLRLLNTIFDQVGYYKLCVQYSTLLMCGYKMNVM